MSMCSAAKEDHVPRGRRAPPAHRAKALAPRQLNLLPTASHRSDPRHLQIGEFLEHGTIAEAARTRSSERVRALTLFASVYGIGAGTARLLWGRGVRTLQDLQRWYDAPVDGEDAVAGIVGPDEGGKEGMIRAALGFREDLEAK
jgi:hypothetical protein